MNGLECLTCKKHISQGGKCYSNKMNCLLYENEPRGKMIRTNITFGIGENYETKLIKFGEPILLEENGKTIEMVCIKINWINLEKMTCNITAEYHENETPKFEMKKKFKIVK